MSDQLKCPVCGEALTVYHWTPYGKYFLACYDNMRQEHFVGDPRKTKQEAINAAHRLLEAVAV